MPAQAALFWESYIQTYIERDLPGISAVASTIDYQSVMRMIAITTGSLLEYSSVANNAHVSSWMTPSADRPTVTFSGRSQFRESVTVRCVMPAQTGSMYHSDLFTS
jgi:hypothetical protein